MKRRRVVLLTVAAVLAVGVGGAGWLAIRADQARDAMTDLMGAVDGARTDLAAGDLPSLAARLPDVQDAAARARSATGDPVWWVGQHLPGIGDDLTAVRVVARAADDLARGPMPDLAAALDPVLSSGPGAAVRASGDPGGGTAAVDLHPLLTAAPALADGVRVLARAGAQLESIDSGGLVGPVRDGVAQVQAVLSAAGAGSDEPVLADDLTDLAEVLDRLPGLLGREEPHDYLVLALNPAELRSQGGIVGAVLVLRVRNGALTIVEQRGTTELPELSGPALPLTSEEQALHGDRLGRWVQDVVLTPDFPRSAELAAAYWQQVGGTAVDGVLAVDTAALAGVVAATGRPLSVDGAQVGADGLEQVLAQDSYQWFGDPGAGDAYYARVAAAAMAVLGEAVHDPRVLARVPGAVDTAVAEGRVRFWLADPAAQEPVSRTLLGGAFLSGGARTGAQAGVFLDDLTAGKVDAYLDVHVDGEVRGCSAGQPVARVTATMAYHPPEDITSRGPQVVGDGAAGVPAGWIGTNLTLYAPRGQEVSGVTRDGEVIGGAPLRVAGRSTQVLSVLLAPGERTQVTVELPAPGGVLVVRSTPTATGPGVLTVACPAG